MQENKKSVMNDLLKPLDAARLAGVSYPTLKQWIYSGKIRSTKTAGGHHRIARSEIERVTGAVAAASPSVSMLLAGAINCWEKLAKYASKACWSR
jgi:excisionase family DNA binding protein